MTSGTRSEQPALNRKSTTVTLVCVELRAYGKVDKIFVENRRYDAIRCCEYKIFENRN